MPVDLPGYVTDLKEHATEHGFHVHDERHFVETYSLRQSWEVDVHPEAGCGGPIDRSAGMAGRAPPGRASGAPPLVGAAQSRERLGGP